MESADGSFSSQYTRWHATLHLPLFHILVGKGQGPTKIKMPPPIRAFTNGAHVCQQSSIAFLDWRCDAPVKTAQLQFSPETPLGLCDRKVRLMSSGQRVVFWDRTFQKWRGVYALDDDPAAAHLLNWDL